MSRTVRTPQRFAGALLLSLAALALAGPGEAQRTAPLARAERPDLGHVAAGSYSGDVISDARGSSRSNVRITVTRTGPNRVRITSDYRRLPAFAATLTQAMQTIQNASGDEVFLLDLSRTPHTLHVTVDDASWAGTRD